MALTIRGQRTESPTPLETVNRTTKGRIRRAPDALTRATVQPPRHAWYLPCKHFLDYAAAVVLSLFALPLVILSALLVKLTSRGPAFYSQTRVGENGKQFRIYKIRSMIHNCESLSGPRWSLPGDPRITLVGRFLRASHLDELPQLLNVLRGEMSLIGPRPERPEFFPDLERSLPGYTGRLTVRPGVTGLAQVNLPADSDVESVRKKLTCDLYYIRHVNPWMDLRIVICTALYAMAVPFRWSRWVLRLPNLELAGREVFVPEPIEPARMRKAG